MRFGGPPPAYYLGKTSRREGHGRDAVPYSPISVRGAWWLAGWHDRDIELSR